MISKISFTKLIIKDIKRRGWLAALAAAGLFLLMPVYTMIHMDSVRAAFAYSPQDALESLYGRFPGLISGATASVLHIALFVLALTLAGTGFHYIHSREKLDFYHSFPIKREQWFCTVYVSGLIIFAVPYAICSALVIAAGYANGIADPALTWKCITAFGIGLLSFLLIYHTGIFAMLLTGTTVTGLIAALILSVYCSVALNMITSLKGVFFEAYYPIAPSLFEKAAVYLSPAALFSHLADTVSGYPRLSLVFAALLFSAVFLAAAFLLYKAYPSEAAGNPLSFPRLAPVLKILISVPASLSLGIFINNYIGASGTKWIIVMGMIMCILICCVIELVYRLDLAQIFRSWKSSLLSVAGVAVILCIFQFDLFGYDTWLPKKDALETIGLKPFSFDSYFQYPFPYGDSYELNTTVPVPEDCRDMAYGLAHSGISGSGDLGAREDGSGKMYTVFYYELSNGCKTSRAYSVDTSRTAALLSQALDDEEYRRNLFPVFHLDRSAIRSLYLYDIYGLPETLSLSPDQVNRLLDAYEQDVLAADAGTLRYGTPLGELSVELLDNYSETEISSGAAAIESVGQSLANLSGFYIYETYTNTLSCLEEYGYTLQKEIDPEEVSSISLYLSADSIRKGELPDYLPALPSVTELPADEFTPVLITDKQDIRALLGNITYGCPGILDERNEKNEYVEIEFRTGYGFNTYYLE